MRANGKLPLILLIHPMHLDSVHIWDDEVGSLIGDGSPTNGMTFVSSLVVRSDNFYTSLANTEAEEIGRIYASSTQEDDDNNTHLQPTNHGKINCLIQIGASEYGEPCFVTTNGKITTTCHNSWASTPAEPSKTPEEHVIIHENDNDCTRIRTDVIEMLLVLTLTDVNLSNNNGYVSAILISGIDDTPGAVINNVTTRTCITHINRVNALSNGRRSINGCVNELQRLNNSWHIINGGSNISPHACNDNGIREPINSCIITSNDINTLVEDCTHPSMGSTYIMSAMIRCVSTRLHITWHYSPDIAQRTTISGAAPIIGHINLVLMCDERDLAYETLDWNNTANAYTAEYGYALINVIDYLSDAHKNISAYAQHGTAYNVLGYNCSCTSGINTALTLRTGSIHRYGIPPDTTDINHGRSNNGINYSEIGIMFVDGTLVSSITYLPDTIQHIVHHNMNNSTINTDDNAFGNNDNISIHLFVDHMLDYVANDHESMSRINSNYKAKNTHTDAGYELSGCIVTLDYGQFNKSYVYTYEPGCDDGIDTALTCTSNSYMSNDANRTCGRSSSSNEIVAFKYNTIVQVHMRLWSGELLFVWNEGLLHTLADTKTKTGGNWKQSII